jgi:NAD(P)-dependent dehydrogenase (short-subunit alcohol dehydrogenase family)
MNQAKKVAIVTGASRGIGAAILQAYRQEGWAVVGNARGIEPSADENILTVSGNISDRSVAEKIVKATLDRFRRIDTIVNNAGIFIGKPFTDYTLDDYRAMLDTNLSGFFHITQLVVPEMVQRRSGHIVQITTTRVDQPVTGSPSALAALTKGGLDAVSRSLAIEYAPFGIRANAVSPGVIKTPMHDPSKYEAMAGLHPLGRMGEATEIADAVLYLERATFVTGETLHVDGGQHAGR